MKQPNSLINESSPYLQQHAYNPVKWIPWSDDVFEHAKKENKLVLISVGYSACHWCHVMEHESFEDEEVATIMNKYFINVKVDREERPDVDQVYMTAVQLMTQRGGWPLNCITLPDGRPIYGGTYFPKEQWKSILDSLHHLFENDKAKAEEYAGRLHEGIVNSELISIPQEKIPFKKEKLDELVIRWKRQFDSNEGGNSRAPKFPLPNNYLFLLQYGTFFTDKSVLKHVELTLDKIAMGGIYDHIGGGFARYSVDMLWKVPHFEKMLYDNAQLISLYSQAYKTFKKPLYKRVVSQTIDWLQREMLHPEGIYYSAIDADSEGEEGKYYCWSMEEYQTLLLDDFTFASDLYSFNSRGYWEEGKYIPLRVLSDKELKEKYNLSNEELEFKIQKINDILRTNRKNRIAPGIDDKCLTSWNALLVIGLCDAYSAFEEEEYQHLAHKIVRWISTYQLKEDYSLFRTRKNEKSTINGFLEDYATVIQSFIRFYEIAGDEQYALKAKKITEYTIAHFQHSESKMFYFTPNDTSLIARKMDINDNVIPASNSIMANNLWNLGHLFEKKEWLDDARQQLTNVYDGMEMYGSGYSNWGILLLNNVTPFYEVVITGKKIASQRLNWLKEYIPNTLTAYVSDDIPLGKYKQSEETLFYVCSESDGCLAPMADIRKVLDTVNVSSINNQD
jgi:uncharacterized protein YyaL (SSP411 family)